MRCARATGGQSSSAVAQPWPCQLHVRPPPRPHKAQDGEARVQLIERPPDVPEIERLLVAEVAAAHQRHAAAAGAPLPQT